MNEDTSAYWRTLLGLDKELQKDALKPYWSRWFFFNSFIMGLFKFISHLICPITAKGSENVPQKPPYILSPNHLSVIDYVAVVAPLPKKIRGFLYPLATKHFYDHPITGALIKMGARAVRIDTIDDFFPALRAAAMILRSGKSVYIKGTYEVLKPETAKVNRGKIFVNYGQPIDPAPYIEMKKTRQAYDVYKEITEELRKRIVELSR